MQTQKADVRSRILDAAREEFRNDAFDGLSMRTIARRAGVTVGNVYRYFQGKDDIFYVLLMEEQERRLDAMYGYIDAGTSGMDKLRRYGLAYLDYVRQNPGEHRKAMECFVRGGGEEKVSPAVLDEMAVDRRARCDRFMAIIREGIADGTVDPGVDPMSFMKQFSMSIRLVLHEVVVLRFEPEEFYLSYLDLILRAVEPPGKK